MPVAAELAVRPNGNSYVNEVVLLKGWSYPESPFSFRRSRMFTRELSPLAVSR